MREIKFKALYKLLNGQKIWSYYGINSKPNLVGAEWITADLQYMCDDDDKQPLFEGDYVRVKPLDLETDPLEIGESGKDLILIHRYEDPDRMARDIGWWLTDLVGDWEEPLSTFFGYGFESLNENIYDKS